MKKALALILAMIMTLALVACGESNTPAVDTPPADTTETTAYKKDVVIGTPDACLTMDVQEITATVDFSAHKLVHEGLFKRIDATGEYLPWLCESYEMDGSVWTLHLRQGVKFSDGSDFTADDVVFTLITRGQQSKQTASFCETLTAEKIDEYTVKVDTGTVNMDFIQRMAHPTYAMLSKTACEADPSHGFEIGTGPYKFKELFENSFASFEKNENYWGEAPVCDTIELRYFSEPSARLIALQNGEIDVCISPSTNELEYVKEDSSLELIETVGSKSVYLTFNTEKEPYSNLEFRQAVAYAIDDQAVIDIVSDGLATISKSTFGPNSAVYCDDQLTGYPYDQAKAKELVEKNGWTGTTIRIMTSDKATDSKAAVTVQSMLNAIGLDAQVDTRGSAEVTAARSSGEIEMMIGQFGSSDYADGVKINCSSTGSYNFARFKDPELDKMLDEALTIEDWNTRKQVYVDVQKKVFDEMCYYYPILRENAYVAATAGAEGFFVRSDGVIDFTYIAVPEK